MLSSIVRTGARSRMPVMRMATTFKATTDYAPSGPRGVDVFLGDLNPSLTAFKLKEAISKRYGGEFTGPRIVFNRETRTSLGLSLIHI